MIRHLVGGQLAMQHANGWGSYMKHFSLYFLTSGLLQIHGEKVNFQIEYLSVYLLDKGLFCISPFMLYHVDTGQK